MAAVKVKLEVNAKGNKKSNLKEGTELQFIGTRWGIVPDNAGEEFAKADSFEQLAADLEDYASKFAHEGKTVEAFRIRELIDSNVFNVRVGQDANRNFMMEEGRVPTEEENQTNQMERLFAVGRGGAKGPRATDQDIANAIKNAVEVKKDARFKQAYDLLKSTSALDFPSVIGDIRAAFTGLGVTPEQVKELAKAA